MTQEKTYSQIRNDFSKKFYSYIVPRIRQYEDERVIRLLASLVVSIISLAWVGWIYYTAFTHIGEFSDNNVKLVLFLLLCAFGNFWVNKKSFEEKIKTDTIMPLVCKCFEDLDWSPYYGVNAGNIIKTSRVIHDFDSLGCDDAFVGQHQDVKFEIMESFFTKGCGRYRRTVFKGAVVKLDMNKNFTGHTLIRPASLVHLNIPRKLKRTKLEDVEFEKRFNVFTDDEVEARYLITPSFMERLNEMKVAFKANSVSCAFYEKSLLIALSTGKDLFSIGSLFKRIDDPKQFFTMFEEILSIIKLIDHFKLNQKIGL